MYYSLEHCLLDLEKNASLLRIPFEVDPNLEMAEIHRQIYEKKGPAILFEKIKNSPFRAASNLYGTNERVDFIFRKEIPLMQEIIAIKNDPSVLLSKPFKYLKTLPLALSSIPRKGIFSRNNLNQYTQIDRLPQVISWPKDGGAFVTLPQVYSEDPDQLDTKGSNIGMYRIQLSGNEYVANQEIGLHYQIHRGIGVHHAKYNQSEQPFKVSIFVGGPPSHAFSAIMPLPEGMSELLFAGMLNNRAFRYKKQDGYMLSLDADFVITGDVVKNKLKPEGPFGDHLGYYSLMHPFPFMKVHKVFHKKNPIWHFTVVSRPPAEDSGFGYLIHQIVKDLTPKEFPGIKSIHAVDAAGVHPLLFAIGSERYMPFREPRPEEILTMANRILGTGQTSLAKYLWITDHAANPNLNIHDPKAFFMHNLQRANWSRDIHFITKTTIDTLDYSGDGLNSGSKAVIATAGPPIRDLATEINFQGILPPPFSNPKMVMPGVIALQAKPFANYSSAITEISTLKSYLEHLEDLDSYPLIVLCDDSNFLAQNIQNFVWATFTRSNPSHDIYGTHEDIQHKHWGCRGALIIDARIKPHHAPILEPDPAIQDKVHRYFTKGGALYGHFSTKY